MVSGTVTKLAGSGVSAFSVGWILSFWMKLIGCTGSELSEGGVLDPVDPTPFVAVASTSCWASCNSAIRAGEFWSWFTLTEEPCGRRTMVYAGILDDDVSRHGLLGDEFECAVLEILVGDVAVVQERDVRVGRLGFLPQRKGQGREPRQQAGLAAQPPASPGGVAPGGSFNVSGGVGERGRSRPRVRPRSWRGTQPAWYSSLALASRAVRCFARAPEVKQSRRCQPKAGRRNPPEGTRG